jgi:hypothetical protein
MAVVEEDKPEMVTLKVYINGTDTNRWHKYGMKVNPFPQVAKLEWQQIDSMINHLDGDPIKSEEELLERLKGFSPKFIDLCKQHYKPGERTSFRVRVPLEQKKWVADV